MEWLALSVKKEIDEVLGYEGEDVIIRCDQEASVEAVRKAVAGLRIGRII